MDPLSSSQPIPNDPERLQEINDSIKKYWKENPLKNIIMPDDLRKYLEENPNKYSFNEDGAVVIDEKNIPPEFLDFIRQATTTFVVTNFETQKDSTAEKPFGLK